MDGILFPTNFSLKIFWDLNGQLNNINRLDRVALYKDVFQRPLDGLIQMKTTVFYLNSLVGFPACSFRKRILPSLTRNRARRFFIDRPVCWPAKNSINAFGASF